MCFEYELALPERKLQLKERYDRHLEEKSVQKKLIDRRNVDETHIVAVFDLQAVKQCPSVSTLNICFLLQIKTQLPQLYNSRVIKKSDQTPKESTDTSEHHDIGAYNDVYCYFWDETQGQRGANEIGSCVLV